MQDLNLRIEFTGIRKCNTLKKNLSKDPILKQFILEFGNKHILLYFDTKEVKEIVKEQLLSNEKRFKLKKTLQGFEYLKYI